MVFKTNMEIFENRASSDTNTNYSLSFILNKNHADHDRGGSQLTTFNLQYY